MPDQQRRTRAWNPDPVIAAVERRNMRSAMALVVERLAPMFDGQPCDRHRDIRQCVGSAALRVLDDLGLEVVPRYHADLADEALRTIVDGDRLVVVDRAVTLYDIETVLN